MQILKPIKLIMVTAFFLFVISLNTYAGTWRQDGNGWWYQNSDGSYPRSNWQWIDANEDHIAYCYYFNNDGYCLLNQETPDGYRVSSSGEWIIADVGLPETKIVNTLGVNLDALPFITFDIWHGTNYKNVNIDFNEIEILYDLNSKPTISYKNYKFPFYILLQPNPWSNIVLSHHFFAPKQLQAHILPNQQ